MTEKYNFETLNQTIENANTEEDIFQYFVRMNKDYKKEKKEGLIDDDVMVSLTELWRSLKVYDDYVYEILEEKWKSPPTVIQDILDFSERYNLVKYERYAEKLDESELAETESLFQAIWNKNCRVEGSISYYDWDEDEYVSTSICLPKKEREKYMYNLKLICAEIIYNRGEMLLRFFVRRGEFELAAVHVGDGRGIWECLSETEILSQYTENGEPMEIEDNETIIFLEKEEQHPKGNMLFLR